MAHGVVLYLNHRVFATIATTIVGTVGRRFRRLRCVFIGQIHFLQSTLDEL